jgi:hypothetical protein
MQALRCGGICMAYQGDDICVKKVKILDDRARAIANKKGLKENDLVILTTHIGSLPEYELEPIKGSPIKYLQNKYLKPR